MRDQQAAKPAAPSRERTPEQIAHDETRADLERLRRERAVLQRGGALGANALMLADSITFMRTLALVDPDNPQAVDMAITDALERNPAWAAPQPRRTP